MRLNNTQKKRIIRRSASLAVALAMLLNETYIWSIIDSIPFLETNDNGARITANAAEETGNDPDFPHDNEVTKEIRVKLEDFVEYSAACQIYSTYHQNDKITIYSTGISDLFESGFSGLGTQSKPFGGSIEIAKNTDITLNLDAPLFNYVYDSVVINNGQELSVSRYYLSISGADETSPIIAKYVYADTNNTDLVTWNINLTTPTDDTDHYLAQFGGFIGTMDDDKGAPRLALNVTMNTATLIKEGIEKTDNKAVVINGSGDLGLACGHMDQGAELTFTYNADRAISKIETSGGDVGGLVGEMESGSVFILKNENAVTGGIDITTTAGGCYAGGLVGKNVGGTVMVYEADSEEDTDVPAIYPVTQNIAGTSGAGGVYGYYKPATALTVETDKYSIDCQVNGTGYTGGLFGVLDTTADVTITDSSESGDSNVVSNHNSGSCTAYGGLIGQYKTDSVNRTLTMDSVTAATSKVGTASYYGGGIGQIEPTTPTYVKFTDFTAFAENAGALTFGGLVASADNAFVYASGVSVSAGSYNNDKTVFTAGNYMGGGLVGSLENGVLQINGVNTITGSSSEPGSGENLKVGKIVGYRDNGLVFMDTGASWSGSFSSAVVDDIGAWGGVIKLDGFTTSTDVISVSGHAVTIGTDNYAFASIGNTDQFAVTALRFQIDGSENAAGNQFVTFANTSKTSSTISSTGITLSDENISLSGTGIYGLTRDNDIGSSMSKCVYSGTFSGGNKTITFATGTIYRHKYNGLFAKLNGGTVQNVTFAGTISVNAKTGMYVGPAAATATGNFTASNVTVDTEMSYSGGSALYLGGILGEADGSIGSVNVSNCAVNANITGGNGSAVLGGVIGQISHNSDNSKAWSFNTVSVSGEISNSGGSKTGGLIGVIFGNYSNNTAHRVLTLDGITVDGLEVSGRGLDMGGLLGYSWLKTDVNVTSVTVQDNSTDSSKKPTVSNSGSGCAGGMVYRATGKWTVNKLDIKDIVITSSGDVGVIVNKGISHDDSEFYTEASRSAIYLCLPSGYVYNIDSSAITSGSVFDELCAYTAPDAGSVLRNGNGVVSINTTFKTDGSSASGSYHARTANGANPNPNSRYYYNLDTLNDTDPAKLMKWGLNQYVCINLKQYFNDPFNDTIAAGTYDMADYSWYPVDLDKNITVNGTFKFHSHEFEVSENTKYTNETNACDRNNLENNQHYTMHCGLFRNVPSGKTLTVGTTVFKGDVGLLDGGSGALICGTVQGASPTSKAAVKVIGPVTLDGVYVYGAGVGVENYAPLLINKSGNYVNLTIANVSTTDAYNTSTEVPYISGKETYPKAASSLIGDVGLSDAPTGITISFSNIKLDSRTADISDSTYNTELDTVYGTNRTIFTRSTLLNKFKYASGSTGKYDYTIGQDWNNGSHIGYGVTYGREVGYTSDSTTTEYPGKEQKYSGSDYYTNPILENAGSTYGGFDNFLPYVYTPYSESNNHHQLRVNHSAESFSGDGTYNHPYIITNGSDLETISKILSEEHSQFSIDIPVVSGAYTAGEPDSNGVVPISDVKNSVWCSQHYTFKYDSIDREYYTDVDGDEVYKENGEYSISEDELEKYLAGAYYKISDAADTITIDSTSQFRGLGNTGNNWAVFRGVIDGNKKTIINNTQYPLIESSNGSVVKDLTIEVTPSSAISITGRVKEFGSVRGNNDYNDAYGAVIAKILGGDNIIDNVSLSLGTFTISLAGDTAQLVPIGGYVGVVVNGGLIFRNMERVDDNGNPVSYGENLFSNVTISAPSNTTKFPATAISDSNMAWLYVNPIVGRIINGYAVTESNAYRPYEDGTRTYQGGTEDELRYWDEINQTEVDSAPSALSHVTMQNGTKHYSIADISNGLTKLSASNATISVPNGQAWFIISLLVNSGESAEKLGFNQDYQMSRQAKYTDIDSTAASSTACSDYNNLAKDDKLNGSNKSAKKGYLYNNYYANTVQLHYADRTVNLSAGTYYLPDGYKGIGNMYAHDDSSTEETDENDYYRMQIINFDGNGATVSMNSSWYFYYADPGNNNALNKFDEAYPHHSMVGFGLFNYQTGVTDSASNQYYNFKLTGNVIADCINSNSATGEHISYIGGLTNNNTTGKNADDAAEYADSNYMPAVGSLIGYATSTTYTNSVALQNMNVRGLRNTGGLIGMTSLESGKRFTYKNTNQISSYDIKVHGATTTGGMIGKNQQSIIDIDNGNATYSLTKVVSECTQIIHNDYNYGVGGFIGMCRTGDNNALNVKNVTVGDKDQDTLSEISATSNKISVGGVVGVITRAKVSIEDCYVYNQSIKSNYHSGGMIGYWATPTNGSDITGVTIYAKNYGSSDKNSSITSTNGSGSAGGFIGYRKNENATVSVSIRNSNVHGYTIGGTALSNAGGAIGIWNGGIVNLQNIDVSSCNIIAKSSGGNAGGLVGSQQGNANEDQNSVYGYNILLKNLNVTGNNKGYILGTNTNSNQVIKLAGFSRQNDQDTSTMEPALVGKPRDSTLPYGAGGYVIFADYTDEASTVGNKDFSNIIPAGSNEVYSSTAIKAIKTVKNATYIGTVDAETGKIMLGDTVGEPSTVITEEEPLDIPSKTEKSAVVVKEEETSAENEYGFKINRSEFGFMTSSIKENGTFGTSDIEGAVWYLEPYDGYYHIYTYDGMEKKYIHGPASVTAETPMQLVESYEADDIIICKENSTNLSIQQILEYCENSDNRNTFKIYGIGKTGFERSGYKSGYCYNSNSPADNILTHVSTIEGEAGTQITATSYAAYTIGSSTFIGGTVTSHRNATSIQQSAYETNCEEGEVLVYISETTWVNQYEQTQNSKPFVTTNPKRSITASQFLTGDGVSSPYYTQSVFKKILDDQTAEKAKAYTICKQLSAEENAEALETIKKEFSNSMTEFKGYIASNENSGITNFPLLVAEDTNKEKLTELINDYLDTLTNTNYNFADTTSPNIYEVGLYKCTFNPATGGFDVDKSASCLKMTEIQSAYYFYMEAQDVDTRDIPQFSLMDVKFKDPSEDSKIVYHLYVPVYVKKVLRFNFNAEVKSGTDYFRSAYTKLDILTRQGFFENLGNPMTIAFEYEYDRTPDEWKEAANAGDSLLTNYYKSLTLKNHKNNGWAANTKMVLVDANNSDKYYYLDTPPAATPTTISLFDFEDDAGEHYKPVPLQSLMTVTIEPSVDGTLTPTTDNTSVGATVFDGTTYYRPITDSDTGLAGSDKFTVTSVSDIKSERYYLSIFTKSDTSNTNIYRYEISSPESFAAAGTGVMYTDAEWTVDNYRANKIDKNTVIHIFTGKLYENSLTLKVTPHQKDIQAMSASNNFLTVDMKANVSLTDNADDSGVDENMYTFRNDAYIYQTFLMMYDRFATVNGSHEVGIDTAANAKVGIRSYYYAGGSIDADLNSDNATEVVDPQDKKVESAKYIELRNSVNLISLLGSSDSGNAATLQVKFDMVYAAGDLSIQFPKKDPDDDAQSSIGTNVIGYSKISSTIEGAANSATYDKKNDISGDDNTLYYTTNESISELTYNVAETPGNPAGRYSYLGINSVETGDDEVFIDTYAIYDTRKLTNSGEFIELTLSLSDKDGYVTPVAGDPTPTGTPLKISNYITDLKIYGAGENDYVIFDQSDDAFSSDTIMTTKSDTLYTIRVRKDLLNTQTEEDEIYLIPIKFKVKTGNALFNSSGLKYSNYKVSLTAAMYSTINSTDYSKSSYAFDHIIYTNARVLTSVVN